MFELQEIYRPRPIRFLELWADAGWRMKVYGIAYRRSRPRPELVALAKDLALRRLPELAARTTHYGVGFLGVHDGRDASFLFLDFWTDENELRHHVYVSPTVCPEQVQYVTPTGLAACVWDLRVLCFERQAWIDTVLANPAGPDLEQYLARRLDETV
jgi:hypothetical protein